MDTNMEQQELEQDINLMPQHQETPMKMLKSWSSHSCLSHSDVLHGLLKPILSHMGKCVDCT